MDSTLVTVTLISMGMASVLSLIVWRMLREERRRSAARVMALSQLAADGGSGPRISRTGGQVSRSPEAGARSRQQRTLASADLPLNRPTAAADPMLFAPRNDARSPWAGRLAVIACLALAGTAAVIFAVVSQQRHVPAREPSTSAPAAPAPLELLSLRDSRDAASLTITGLVQNPSNGTALSRVAVTAFAFDGNGNFLASGRALLDAASLAPGMQSPFSVSVPVTGDVARYRIGFRTDDGRVVAHVDERGRGAGGQGPETGGATFDE